MTPIDIAAFAVFALLWLGYEPARRLATRGGGINDDMGVIRAAWMRRMLARPVRIADSALLGHLLNSASFFASSNLLIIAAATGLVFGAGAPDRLGGLSLVQAGPVWLMEAKIGLVILTLVRGLLDFIWAIRQINYILAVFGAAPEAGEKPDGAEAYLRAATGVLNPAMSAFNRGVRAYYFALAAAAWVISPWALAIASAGTFALIVWRQTASEAAGALHAARVILEAETETQTRR